MIFSGGLPIQEEKIRSKMSVPKLLSSHEDSEN